MADPDRKRGSSSPDGDAPREGKFEDRREPDVVRIPQVCAQVRSPSAATCLPREARRSGLCSGRRLPARHRDRPGRCICRQKRSRGFRFSRGVGHTDDVTLRQRKKIPLLRCRRNRDEVDVCNAIGPGTMRDKGSGDACVCRARRGRYLAVEKAVNVRFFESARRMTLTPAVRCRGRSRIVVVYKRIPIRSRVQESRSCFGLQMRPNQGFRGTPCDAGSQLDDVLVNSLTR